MELEVNSNSDEAYSSGGVQRQRKRDEEYSLIMSGTSETDRLGAKRNLRRTCLQRFDWMWRVALTTSLTLSMMLIYFIEGNLHLNQIKGFSQLFNETTRIEQTIVAAESFQR